MSSKMGVKKTEFTMRRRVADTVSVDIDFIREEGEELELCSVARGYGGTALDVYAHGLVVGCLIYVPMVPVKQLMGV